MANIGGNVAETFYYYFLIRFSLYCFFHFYIYWKQPK